MDGHCSEDKGANHPPHSPWTTLSETYTWETFKEPSVSWANWSTYSMSLLASFQAYATTVGQCAPTWSQMLQDNVSSICSWDLDKFALVLPKNTSLLTFPYEKFSSTHSLPLRLRNPIPAHCSQDRLYRFLIFCSHWTVYSSNQKKHSPH